MDKEQTAMERLRLASDMSLRLYHRGRARDCLSCP